MSISEELKAFTRRHRAHGEMWGYCGPNTPDGHRFEIFCHCGAMLIRWIAEEDPVMDIIIRWLGAG